MLLEPSEQSAVGTRGKSNKSPGLVGGLTNEEVAFGSGLKG